jgi:hypothetical protein
MDGSSADLIAKLSNRSPGGNSNFSSFDVYVPSAFAVDTSQTTSADVTGNNGSNSSAVVTFPSGCTATAGCTTVRAGGRHRQANSYVQIAIRVSLNTTPTCGAAINTNKWAATAYTGTFSTTTFRQLGEDPTQEPSVNSGVVTDEQVSHYLTTFRVCNAPVLDAIGDKSVEEGSTVSFTATATDADVPAQTLTFSLADGSGCTGTEVCTVPSGASITSAGAFSWTPTEAQGPGTYKLKVGVSDGELTDDEQITITVTEANVDPVLAAIGNKTAVKDTQLTFTATATDADVPAQTLTFSLTAGTTGCDTDPICTLPSVNAPSFTSGGAFSWTPDATQVGNTYRWTAVVSDGLGGSDSEEFDVSVAEGNVQCDTAINDSGGGTSTTVKFLIVDPETGCPVTKTYSLTVSTEGDTITLDVGGGSSLRSIVTSNWAPKDAENPLAATTVFPGLNNQEEDEVWCNGTYNPNAADFGAVMPTGHSWCLITRESRIDANGKVLLKEVSLLEGDAYRTSK